MAVHELHHPLVKHKVSLLREDNLSTGHFRHIVAELGNILAYEACRDLPTESYELESWQGAIQGIQISGKKATVVPILRAGVGMVDGVLSLMPHLKVSVVGLARDETTLKPVAYYENLVSKIDQRTALIVDPMLATGGSLDATIKLLKKAGCLKIKALVLVAAPEGLANIEKQHPDVDIYTASIDEGLNDQGYIIPGLGDAGDKIFGTKS